MSGSATPGWALVFDFDGVLADSVEVKTAAFSRLFSPFGDAVVRQVEAHHRNHGGMSRFDKFRLYYRDFLGKELDEAGVQRLNREFAALVVDAVVEAPEIPGVGAFLERVSRKLPCFVDSAAPEVEVHEIVARRGWSHHFRLLLGTPTNKQDNLRKILEQFSLDPGKTLFFGDAVSDYKAATACGVHFLGIVRTAESALLAHAPGIRHLPDFLDVHRQLAQHWPDLVRGW
ncbi:MAG: HAD family hydrolase [Magnetococcales bacterium]|nr:HAD family hydrolase [Magnetococcales bacterium]